MDLLKSFEAGRPGAYTPSALISATHQDPASDFHWRRTHMHAFLGATLLTSKEARP